MLTYWLWRLKAYRWILYKWRTNSEWFWTHGLRCCIKGVKFSISIWTKIMTFLLSDKHRVFRFQHKLIPLRVGPRNRMSCLFRGHQSRKIPVRCHRIPWYWRWCIYIQHLTESNSLRHICWVRDSELIFIWKVISILVLRHDIWNSVAVFCCL